MCIYMEIYVHVHVATWHDTQVTMLSLYTLYIPVDWKCGGGRMGWREGLQWLTQKDVQLPRELVGKLPTPMQKENFNIILL